MASTARVSPGPHLEGGKPQGDLKIVEKSKTCSTRVPYSTLAREPESPLALVINKDNQSRTAITFPLATAGAGKHQPGYSRPSRKKKRAPAHAPRAIEKEHPSLPTKKPIANPRAKHSANGNRLLRVLGTQPMTRVPSSQESLHRRLLSRDSSLLLSQETSRETSCLLLQETPCKRHKDKDHDSNSRFSIPCCHDDHHHK